MGVKLKSIGRWRGIFGDDPEQLLFYDAIKEVQVL
jgi:hypothetical protein